MPIRNEIRNHLRTVLTIDSSLALSPLDSELVVISHLEGRLGGLDGLVGSIELVITLAPADVDIVDTLGGVVQQLGDIGDAGRLLGQHSIVHIIVVVDVRGLGNRADLVDMSLAGGKDLDGALPDAIDLSQCANSGNTGTGGKAAEPRRSLGDSGLGDNSALLGNNSLLGLIHGSDFLSSMLKNDFLSSSGGGGVGLDLNFFLLVSDNLFADNFLGDFSLVDDLLDLFGLLKGLVSLDLIRPGA